MTVQLFTAAFSNGETLTKSSGRFTYTHAYLATGTLKVDHDEAAKRKLRPPQNWKWRGFVEERAEAEAALAAAAEQGDLTFSEIVAVTLAAQA